MAQATSERRRPLPRGRGYRPPPGRSYSLFVTIMKFLLPTVAAGLIIVVTLWSQMNLSDNRFSPSSVQISTEDVQAVRMVNPRYEGIDEESRPFSITADFATQVDEESDVIQLSAPKADITLTSGDWIALSADEGHYRRKNEMLDLAGMVSLFHDKGYELHTSSATIDLHERSAAGQEPVEGQGPAGQLSGQGFSVKDSGDNILLTGQSRVVLYPTAQEKQP
jgi:lipopolysaccharide export system protein LptC